MGRKPFDKSGRTDVHYWLKPITRIRIKEMSKELHKPVALIIEVLVDEAYQVYKENKTELSMFNKIKAWLHKKRTSKNI